MITDIAMFLTEDRCFVDEIFFIHFKCLPYLMFIKIWLNG